MMLAADGEGLSLLLFWLVVGGLAGWLASLVAGTHDRMGCLLNIAVGIVGAVILGVNHRSLEYFAENRPDMTALMFAALAMLLIGYGLEDRRALPVIVGSACLVIGFFFKQTAAPFAAVPLAASLLRWEKPTRSRTFWTLFPLGVMGGVILGLDSKEATAAAVRALEERMRSAEAPGSGGSGALTHSDALSTSAEMPITARVS